MSERPGTRLLSSIDTCSNESKTRVRDKKHRAASDACSDACSAPAPSAAPTPMRPTRRRREPVRAHPPHVSAGRRRSTRRCVRSERARRLLRRRLRRGAGDACRSPLRVAGAARNDARAEAPTPAPDAGEPLRRRRRRLRRNSSRQSLRVFEDGYAFRSRTRRDAAPTPVAPTPIRRRSDAGDARARRRCRRKQPTPLRRRCRRRLRRPS